MVHLQYQLRKDDSQHSTQLCCGAAQSLPHTSGGCGLSTGPLDCTCSVPPVRDNCTERGRTETLSLCSAEWRLQQPVHKEGSVQELYLCAVRWTRSVAGHCSGLICIMIPAIWQLASMNHFSAVVCWFKLQY